jgi:predicted Fe-Mo cluster-binding NifX family protein
MKICVSAVADSLDAQVDPRFGRCHHFVIVDSDVMTFEAVPNEAAQTAGGAGIQAAQAVVSRKVEVVLTGNIGPKAFHALSAADIKIVTGASGTVREAVEEYMKGELSAAGHPTVSDHFGVGGPRGRRRET